MKIVVFIDWFAPAYKAGGPIQSVVNLVDQFTEGTEYRIVCSNRDLDGTLLQGVAYDSWVTFNNHTQVWYNADNKKVRQLLKELSNWQPDVFFINGIYSFYYNLLPIFFGKAGKKIISTRGMLHTGALSQKSFKKKIYLWLWTISGIARRHSFHATNDEEKQFIERAFGKNTKVFIAANLPRTLQGQFNHLKHRNTLELISVGLISPMKNYLEVLKALEAVYAQVKYTIYGPVKDAAYWQQCQDQIKRLPPNITVLYKGDLPSAKVTEALSKAHVFILPSKSENFGHAIYEAFSAGLPVITSHNTPWNGLEEVCAGFNISPQNGYELSKAICFFAAAGEKEMEKWSKGAKAYAANSIDLANIKVQYRHMFQA